MLVVGVVVLYYDFNTSFDPCDIEYNPPTGVKPSKIALRKQTVTVWEISDSNYQISKSYEFC